MENDVLVLTDSEFKERSEFADAHPDAYGEGGGEPKALAARLRPLGTTSLYYISVKMGMQYATLHRWFHNPKNDPKMAGRQKIMRYLVTLPQDEIDEIFK